MQTWFLLLLFLLSGGHKTQAQEQEEYAAADEYAAGFLNALSERDMKKAGSYWIGGTDESSAAVLEQAMDDWDGREVQEVKQISQTRYAAEKDTGRPAGTQYLYEVKSEGEVFLLELSITDLYRGKQYIDSFRISKKKEELPQKVRVRIRLTKGQIALGLFLISGAAAGFIWHLRHKDT